MAFTNETEVRLRLQLPEAAHAPADLIVASIDDAHALLLPLLAAEVDIESPPQLLARGEALLAGAMTLRALAAREAVTQKQLSLGGQRTEAGPRFTILQTAAKAIEAEAWETLAPFLRHLARHSLLLTESTPVLGS